MNEYVVALLNCKGIGNKKLLNYIEKYNFNFELIKSNISELISKNDFINFDEILRKAEKEISLNKSKNINMITLFDSNYPEKLLRVKDPILYLYYIGNIKLLTNNSVAIIGSREILEEEANIAKKIAADFSKEGITVVSGLALGADTNAHIGSFNKKGATIAVLPSALDIVVPQSNKKLAKEIIDNNGLLVSEYSIGMIVNKYNFAKRDRIQAALADAVIVIKASEKSGTMLAVKCAQDEGKYVAQLVDNHNPLIDYTYVDNEENFRKIIAIIKSRKKSINDTKSCEQQSLF